MRPFDRPCIEDRSIPIRRFGVAQGEEGGNRVLLSLKRLAQHQRVNEFTHREVLVLRRRDDLLGEIFIRKSERTPQSIPDQVLDESTSKVPFPVGDEVAQLTLIEMLGGERSALPSEASALNASGEMSVTSSGGLSRIDFEAMKDLI